jgi:hypothetical protein
MIVAINSRRPFRRLYAQSCANIQSVTVKIDNLQTFRYYVAKPLRIAVFTRMHSFCHGSITVSLWPQIFTVVITFLQSTELTDDVLFRCKLQKPWNSGLPFRPAAWQLADVN